LRRVGGTRTLKVDCRIVAATHRDLADAARFRQDLYFRLAGLTITLPPLRDRDEDALLLAKHFLHEFAVEYRKALTGFSPEAEKALLRHAWPGNVRELRAAISYAAMMVEGPVVHLELPEPVLRASVIPPPPKRVQDIVPLDEIEVQYCRGVLALCKGNRVLAAEKLGINRHTLAKKVGEGDGGEDS
jgi:DNA-binding NtrC family response regulator